MKISSLNALNTLPYFTIESMKQFLGEEMTNAGSVRTALYRWMKFGQVIQLKKGVYMPRRFYELHIGDAGFLPAVSAILLPQSYVSLEFILQRQNILTDVTYPITAVTLKNTRVIENTLATFSYRHIQNSLYSGFKFVEYYGILFAQASVAKALFDFLYLRPSSGATQSSEYDLAGELRLNLDEFLPTDREEFVEYVTSSRMPKMNQILDNFRRTVWRR